MLEQKLGISETLYLYVNAVLELERELETLDAKDLLRQEDLLRQQALLKQLIYVDKQIDSFAGFYIDAGHLPYDWEYNLDTASSCVPIKCALVPTKNLPRNLHMNRAILGGEPAKAARLKFKKLDKKLKNAKNGSASSQSDDQKIDKAPMMEPKLEILEKQKFMMQTRSRTRSLLAKEDAGKLAKKGSASSQSNYQKIDMMEPKLEIPEDLYACIKESLKTEQKLKTCTRNEGLLRRLNNLKELIGFLSDFYKENGFLPSDWEYHPDTASSYVPKCLLAFSKKNIPRNPHTSEHTSEPAEKEINMDIPRNPHINSARLVNKREKALFRNFKKLDKTFKTITRKGIPSRVDENIFTRLDENHEFVTFICDFAVRVFNESCQMYRNNNNNNNNNNNIVDAKVQECIYVKVLRCYLFYMTIEAVEQGKSGAYEINLRCNLNDGAIVVDSFCLKGPEALGTRERDSDSLNLEYIYQTVKDDSLTDPEVYYYKSGLVRRTGGYDYYNPRGWDRLWEWDD